MDIDPLAPPRVLLQAVRVLHERGAQRVAIFPTLAPSGLYWRCSLIIDGEHPGLGYSSSGGWRLPGHDSDEPVDADGAADAIWSLLSDEQRARASAPDPAYATWYIRMLETIGQGVPILYDDSPGPAPYELGHLRVLGGGREATVPLPPGDSLDALLKR